MCKYLVRLLCELESVFDLDYPIHCLPCHSHVMCVGSSGSCAFHRTCYSQHFSNLCDQPVALQSCTGLLKSFAGQSDRTACML